MLPFHGRHTDSTSVPTTNDNIISITSEKREKQLGMGHGKAQAILRKIIMFDMAKRLNVNFCYKCGSEIENIDDFTIEHKEPWLDSENPNELFFGMDNIAFSHFICNVSTARQNRTVKHPSALAYRRGCRCNECTKENTIQQSKYRNNKLLRNSNDIIR
jgi:hypothetical protein